MLEKTRNLIRIVGSKLWAPSTTTLITAAIVWWFLGVLLAFVVVILGLSAIFYSGQDLLLYHPNDPPDSRTFLLQPGKYMLPHESLKIPTRDGTLIHMFMIKHTVMSNNPPTIVFFHGNAGNMGQRLSNVYAMYINLNVNILMVEYRGYGLSEGTPSERGLYEDAKTALEYLFVRHDIDHSKIILFGRSLGGAIAIDLASRPEFRGKIWGLIVENTFTSIPDMAKILLRIKCLQWLPRFVHKNQYASLEKIGRVTASTLIIYGSSDCLVPPSMSEALFSRCGAIYKKLAAIKGGNHDDTWAFKEYFPTILQFISNMPPLTGEPFFEIEGEASSLCITVHNV